MRALIDTVLAQTVLAQTVTTEVEEAFRWLEMPPLWVVVLVVVPALVAFVVFFYRREVFVGHARWRWPLAMVRILVILAILAMIARPARRTTTYETRDSTVLVLVDESLSMDIADRYSRRDLVEEIAAFFRTSPESIESTTRYDLVRRLFRDEDLAFFRKLREKGKVVVATFAGTLRERGRFDRLRTDGSARDASSKAGDPLSGSLSGALVDVDALFSEYAQIRGDRRVQETRIADALRDGVSSVVGSGFGGDQERVSGVLLITDGQENAGSTSALDVARRFGERGVPIQVIGIGNPDDPKDVRVVHVDVSDVVLVDDLVSFDVTVAADGFEGERVPVRLLIEDDVEDTEYVVLEGGGRQQSVRLEHRPRTAGEIDVRVEIERLGGEVFYDNNSFSKTIRVLDEKIRVLYLENLPHWEYRYLEGALTRDATMEAQCWLYSADPDFVQESSPSMPPLARPPRDRAELFAYHVIILGDVPAELLGSDLIALLKDFVYEGGGLVSLSGRNANPWAYLRTDLAVVLPVDVPQVDLLREQDPVTDSFKVELTPEGRELSVMRLDNDREENARLWESSGAPIYSGLPPFFWYAKVGKEKATAVVLARHPHDEVAASRTRRVVFAYMNYGRGRTFFSAVDNTWRWRAGVDNLWFGRFWGQVVRFVAGGRLQGDTPRYAIATDKPVYAIGETVKIDARVFDADMKPSTEPTLSIYHSMEARVGEPPQLVELASSELKGPGSYEGAINASLRGRHDVWIGSEAEPIVSRLFTVEIPALESRDPKLDREALENVAKASGGQYHDLHRAAAAVDQLEGVARSQEGLVESDDLWDEWWVLLLFTILISSEWIARKMARLL